MYHINELFIYSCTNSKELLKKTQQISVKAERETLRLSAETDLYLLPPVGLV